MQNITLSYVPYLSSDITRQAIVTLQQDTLESEIPKTDDMIRRVLDTHYINLYDITQMKLGKFWVWGRLVEEHYGIFHDFLQSKVLLYLLKWLFLMLRDSERDRSCSRCARLGVYDYLQNFCIALYCSKSWSLDSVYKSNTRTKSSSLITIVSSGMITYEDPYPRITIHNTVTEDERNHPLWTVYIALLRSG